MKRPIMVIAIGYIIGIIVGLYFNKSIVLFYALIVIAVLIKNRTKDINSYKKGIIVFSLKRYTRYIKLYINKTIIVTLIISSIISNSIILLKNKHYLNTYDKLSKSEIIVFRGIVVSDKESKNYNNRYIVKIKENGNNHNHLFGSTKLYIYTKKNIELSYGDEINVKGKYEKPSIQRNYKGFDYSKYLKQIGIYGTVKCDKVELLEKNKGNIVVEASNSISKRIVANVKTLLKDDSSIFLGLMLGNKEDLDEETMERFKNASMIHVLAVSGMHISYIIYGIQMIFGIILGKRKANFISIFVLIFYMFLSNFTPSVTRAGIMGILLLISNIIHMKDDVFSSMSIAILSILIYNPFLINNLGLQLSFLGVLGIVLLNKRVLKLFNNIQIKNRYYKYKIRPKIQKYLEKTKQILSVSFSVQLFIIPILIYNSNVINPYFFISNFLLSIILGPIMICSFIFLIICLISIKYANYFKCFISIFISTLKLISNIGKSPFSKINISTPCLFWVLLYYLLLLVIFYLLDVYFAKKANMTQMRIRNLIAFYKIKYREKKKTINRIILFVTFFIILISFIPSNLKIYFIDVGQGDSTLIVTPQKKTILIDGGGSSNSNYDIGKNVLIPYVLDRGFTKIDYVIISHFDSDHVRRYFIFNGRA